MYERLLERKAEEALSDTPVVLIVGPRRAGKTTLVRKIGGTDRTYVTLDDQTTLDAAQSDPAGFVRGLNEATIDEIQRAPELLLAIKKSVDEDYRPGPVSADRFGECDDLAAGRGQSGGPDRNPSDASTGAR